jgi:TMEM141 protein family
MSSAQRIKELHSEKHPGIENYLECMVRARFAGLAAFCLGL